MKNLAVSLLIILFAGCSTDQPVEIKAEKVEEAAAPAKTAEVPMEFTKYPSVKEMLKEAYDFSEDEGTLKFLSKEGKPVHVQVSKAAVDGDPDKVLIEQTKRDIVYVAFQAFAQTDIDELTITSIPMKEKGKYLEKFKMTSKVDRATAKAILQKYLNTENFQTLFKLDGTLWLPSDQFDQLKFKNLDAVFNQLSN